MRRVILLTAIAALLSGLVGAFAFGLPFGEATAAPPPPSPTKVLEQNLDGDGLIRVHEQGMANVTGTVNVGNLPAVQDVNVLSVPSQDSGPLEFTHVMARMCTPSDSGGGTTGFCAFGDAPVTPLDVNAQLTALAGQGWRLMTVSTPNYNNTRDIVVYTLSRPVP